MAMTFIMSKKVPHCRHPVWTLHAIPHQLLTCTRIRHVFALLKHSIIAHLPILRCVASVASQIFVVLKLFTIITLAPSS